ncbi:3993_t:CDS:2, partial [Paraglomus occultum]
DSSIRKPMREATNENIDDFNNHRIVIDVIGPAIEDEMDADKPQKITDEKMKEFKSTYRSMAQNAKWVLSTGKVVEDELFLFGKRRRFE